MNKTELDNIKRILVDDDPIVYNPFDYLNKDDYTSFMIVHLQNQFNKSCVEKVRSHILMTQMIYLMERKAVFVDIQNSKIFYNSNNAEFYALYKNDDELYHSLYAFFVKLGENEFDEYEEFRAHTRIIMDNLDNYENKAVTLIWYDLLKLSKEYFLNNVKEI